MKICDSFFIANPIGIFLVEIPGSPKKFWNRFKTNYLNKLSEIP